MSQKRGRARRPAAHLTRGRAARLYQLVRELSEGPKPRAHLLKELRIGLRTFYREVELLARAGIRIQLSRKMYELRTTLDHAEKRLPFPDPQLTFSEMRQLADCPGMAAQRLAGIYREVLNAAAALATENHRPKRRKS